MRSDGKGQQQSKSSSLKRLSHRIDDTAGAEERLPQGEERYRLLFNSIDEAFCIIEVLFDEEERPVDFRYLEANPAFEEQTGLEDPVGKRARELVPGIEAHWFETYGEVALTGQPRRFENEVGPLGRHFDVYAFRVGKPKERKVAVLFKDITERKEVEEALRESEERFRLLVESTAQAVWETNAEGEVVTVSPSWRAYTGQAVDEVMGYGWVDAVHPEDRAYAERQWREAVAARRRVDAVFRLRAPDGGWRWTNVIAAPLLDERGEVKKWVGMNIDITERKEAEEALRESEARLEAELRAVKQLQRVSTQLIREENLSALYEKILDAAIDLMDADTGSMQKYLPEREELRLLAWRGFEPEAAASRELITVESGSVCGEALRQGERVIVEDVETCGFMAGTEDLDFYRRSGIRAAQTTPLVSRSGQMVGMLTTHWREPREPDEQVLQLLDILAREAADLIDRLRAEEALKELNETLEERVKERTRQVEALTSALAEAEEKERERIADVLHDDVQQLLYGAELSLRALRRRTGKLPYEELRQELEELLDRAEEAFDEAQESTRTLSMELSPPLLRGEDLSTTFEWLARHFEERYGLSVELDLAEDFCLPDEALRRFLFQLTRELLFNVVKHAEAEEARVEGRRAEGVLHLRVSDEGRGFEKERVFKGKLKGRGLRAMEARLELIGGELAVKTAPGEGTHVTISVPIRAEEEE